MCVCVCVCVCLCVCAYGREDANQYRGFFIIKGTRDSLTANVYIFIIYLLCIYTYVFIYLIICLLFYLFL